MKNLQNRCTAFADDNKVEKEVNVNNAPERIIEKELATKEKQQILNSVKLQKTLDANETSIRELDNALKYKMMQKTINDKGQIDSTSNKDNNECLFYQNIVVIYKLEENDQKVEILKKKQKILKRSEIIL